MADETCVKCDNTMSILLVATFVAITIYMEDKVTSKAAWCKSRAS